MILRATTTAVISRDDGTEYTIREGVAYNDNDPEIRDLLKRFPNYFDKGGK